jgi:hypothetical protein
LSGKCEIEEISENPSFLKAVRKLMNASRKQTTQVEVTALKELIAPN